MLSDRKNLGLLESVHIELFLRIYLIARRIKALVKVQNSDRLNDVAVLIILRDKQVSVSELAVMLSIKPSAMSEKVKRLEVLGLVRRIKSADGREKVVEITAKGREEWQEVVMEIYDKCRGGECEVKIKQAEVRTALNILNRISL